MVKLRAAWVIKPKQESGEGEREGKLGERDLGEKGFIVSEGFFLLCNENATSGFW